MPPNLFEESVCQSYSGIKPLLNLVSKKISIPKKDNMFSKGSFSFNELVMVAVDAL